MLADFSPKMLARVVPRAASRVNVLVPRTLSSARFYSQYVDDTPEYPASHLYPKEGTFVPSSTSPSPATGRPVPLNVALNDYAAFKHPAKYGDKVADITLASFMGTKDLDFYADFLLRAAFYLKIPAKGPSPLPRKIKRWTVIRSPFVMAKSKQNFERITYRRVIKLYDANPEVVQVLLSVAQKYPLPGVGVKATLFTSENVDMVENMDVPSLVEQETPLAINKVDLQAADGEVAQKVMELLKDPRFGVHSEDIEEFEMVEEVDVEEVDVDIEEIEEVETAKKA